VKNSQAVSSTEIVPSVGTTITRRPNGRAGRGRHAQAELDGRHPASTGKILAIANNDGFTTSRSPPTSRRGPR